MQRFCKSLPLLSLALLLIPQFAIGIIEPDYISYQGRLTDAGGEPLDGIYSIAFSIWDDSTSGTQMWAETLSVEVTDGLLSTNLGLVHALDADVLGGTEPGFLPYLEIEVTGEVIGPRTPLGRAPSAFTAQRVWGDITTAPGEVMVSDKVQITTSPTSAEVMLKSGDGDEAIEVTIDNTAGANISMIGPAGDTAAQYGPDEMVMVQLQPEPPSPSEFTRMGPGRLVMGIDPWFDKIMAEVCNEGMILTDSATGDTAAQYSPDKMFMVQLQPEPPLPPLFARMGPEGLVMGVDPWFDKIMAEVCNEGLILTDSGTGDTAAQYSPDNIFMVQLQPEPPLPSEFTRMGPGQLVMGIDPSFDRIMAEVCNEGVLLKDTATGDTVAQFTPEHIRFEREAWKSELSNLWFEMREQGTTDSRYVVTSVAEVAFGYQSGGNPELTLARYGYVGVDLTDTTENNNVSIRANTSEATHGDTDNDAILGGDGVSFYKAGTGGDGLISKHTAELMIFSNTSLTGDDTTVVISTEGIKVDTAAGSAKTVTAGEYYKDNSIVAWARVSSAATSIEEFGVSSVTKTSTGYYTVVIDATLSAGIRLIPIVVPEIDSQPTSASSVRLASVNQTSTSNTFEVFINDGYYAPVDNDFVFVVTGR